MSVVVKNIVKLYGQQRALDDVSFGINTGQVVGFLGPNGAGKSTMMKILCCFIPSTSGHASVMGYDVNEYPVEVRKHVGYLPEHNPLYLDMYVKEFLAFVAGVHRMPKPGIAARVDAMIAMTGLQLEQKKKIGALSRGYRQRVGLAQAMIHNPDVLILDEPTSGLDPNQLVEIRALIKNIGKEKTVILSTHIMQEVEAICDRAIIINRGKIVADDLTRNLQQHLLGERIFIAEFSQPVLKTLLLELPFVAGAENMGGHLWRIQSRNRQDIRQQLFEFAVQQKIGILKMDMEEHSLEDVFHHLTSMTSVSGD